MLACAPIPKGRYTLDTLDISGDRRVDDEDIQKVIASQPTPRFLGLFSGVIYDYEVFDRYVLERDLQRIERYYRARGYYEARVRAADVVLKGRGAKVHIEVEEGEPVILRRVDLHGIEALPPQVIATMRRAATSELPLGRAFDEGNFEKAEQQLKQRLEDLGYAYVALQRSANVDLPRRQASAGFWIKLGPKARFGRVRIVGLGPFPEPPVRRALDIRPGDPYSRSELDEAKHALLDLNVFSAVSIEPDLDENTKNEQPSNVPLVVRVERSKLRSVHLGGGLQLDTQRTDLHLIAGWEDSNLGGGFRRFLVEAVPGVVLFPTRLPDLQAPKRVLPELRLRSEFRQPGFIESRTNGLVRLQGAIYPVLLTSDYDPSAPVLGYRDLRASAGLERSLWRLYGTLTHNVQVSSPFTYIGEQDPDLKTALISYPELLMTLDLRNDRVEPHKGAYFSLDTQVAGLGGDARDLKVQPEARAYVPLARHWTLAARSTVGLLFAQNYGKTVAPNAAGRDPINQEPGVSRAAWVKDIQLMFLRGFFSGGSGSNRGYASREIGPHGAVPFYNPGQSMSSPADCEPTSASYSRGSCNLPLGGFTLWEASLELRYPVKGPLSGTVFADTSDVAPEELLFRFDRPHLGLGAGLRYDTPIGPVRFDLGYRVPGVQAPASANEIEPREIFGLPLAASFGIGEAF
jgi:outer membrane protein insertion porin family/translocation and assembly module TamA